MGVNRSNLVSVGMGGIERTRIVGMSWVCMSDFYGWNALIEFSLSLFVGLFQELYEFY